MFIIKSSLLMAFMEIVRIYWPNCMKYLNDSVAKCRVADCRSILRVLLPPSFKTTFRMLATQHSIQGHAILCDNKYLKKSAVLVNWCFTERKITKWWLCENVHLSFSLRGLLGPQILVYCSYLNS
jgi:hypothetical protein